MTNRLIPLLLVAGAGAWAGDSWEQVQELKVASLASAAERAVQQQQRTTSLPPIPLTGTWSAQGGVVIEDSTAWDGDGDGRSRRITVTGIPRNDDHKRIRDRISIRFDQPINVLEKGTGIALWVNAPAGLSQHLRVGVHLKIAGTDQDPIFFADTPLVQRFGDNPHLIYFDWGYAFDNSCGVFKTPPREFLEKVVGLDLVLVQKRLPKGEGEIAPADGSFHLDGLSLVDWYDGSYDSDRFRDGKLNANWPLVAQGRTQQVALIAARFGGEAGLRSAIRAMDMMARIQSWDGSWPEMRTRMQGEFTHGMITADLARALVYMRQQKRPELAEQVAVRHWKMTRDDLYEQMLWRAAKSRSPAPLDTYNDSYLSGQGAMRGGANRPMVFILSQFETAQVMSDEARRRELLAEYDVNMDMLLKYQGATAGGWPIFGEGNRYKGEGLSWDVSYSSDHVAIMANASRVTNDPRWGEIMRRFDTVVAAMMLANGREIDGGLSERGEAKRAGLKAGDIVHQEALRHNAPLLAQWGFNVSQHCWQRWPEGGTVWPFTRTARGYGLGAFLTWQVYDLQAEPQPRDLQVVFPRQWPLWTAVWKDKKGQEVRRSRLVAEPGGKLVSDFAWAVGQYPVLSAVPVAVTVEGANAVELQPELYEGNVLRLPAGTQAMLASGGADAQLGKPAVLTGDAATLALTGPTVIEITAAEPPLRIRLRAIPQQPGAATVKLRLLRQVEQYTHSAKP